MTPFYRCSHGHDEVRWAWTGGRACWHCGAWGKPCAALTITAIDAFIVELDDTFSQNRTPATVTEVSA